MRLLWLVAAGLASWIALIGLIALCVRVAGGPQAWKVGLLVVATAPILGFATRNRG